MKPIKTLIFALLLSSTACTTVFNRYEHRYADKTPQSFSSNQDTASIGKISVKDYFQDADLKNLIETALKNNPDLQIAAARVEQAKAGLMLANGAFLPTLTGNVSASGDRYGKYTMTGVGNFDTNKSPNISPEQVVNTKLTPDFFAGFRSEWEIGLWGKMRNEKKAAAKRFWATEEAKKLVTTDIVSAVAMLYYKLISFDDELKVVERNIELQTAAVEIIKNQKEAGRATELAVRQAEAQLNSTKSLEFVVRQNILHTENVLNTLLGRYPTPIQRSSDILNLSLPAGDLLGQPASVLLRRPDVREAFLRAEASQNDLQAAYARFLPSLNLNTYIAFNAFSMQTWFNPASLGFGILGGLFAPVLQKNQIRSNLKFTSAEAQANYAFYEKTLLTTFSEINTLYGADKNLENVFSFKKQENDILEKATLTATDLYKSGYATYLEVVFTQKSVLETKLQLLDLREAQFENRIRLYRALGGGWE
jgi:NodT family efflux transporter outer membrane factor (OMF) lipoprotein